MANELVVKFTHSSVPQARQLDVANGYLYDEHGAQCGRLEPKEDTNSYENCQLVAESLHDRNLRTMSDTKLGSLRERTVKMDLGTSDVHLPAAMPNFAGGYKNYAPIADMICPPLLANKPSDKFFTFSSDDAYQLAAPNVGAPGAAVNEITPRPSNSTYTTVEYAIGAFVPTEIDAAADAPLKIRQAAGKRCMNAMMLSRELRVANLVTASGSWNSNNVVTLASGFQWDGGASSDPIKDIQTRIEQSDMEVTGIGLSEPAWHAFQRNANVQKYFTFKDGSQAVPSPGQMSAILQLPPFYVGRMKYKNSTGGKSYVWGNNVVLFRQPEEMPPTTQDDIATAYTFRWNLSNTSIPDGRASGGIVVREFFNQLRGTAGGSMIVVMHFDAEVMTGKTVGGLIVSAYQ